MGNRATLTPFTRRLTPGEVARFWFRKGTDFVGQIHDRYPDFPRPGPDGLYLASQVESWFDRWHGASQTSGPAVLTAEQEALEIARHGRRQSPARRAQGAR